MTRRRRFIGWAGISAWTVIAMAAAAGPAGAARIHLLGYSPQLTVAGPGCGTTGTVAVRMPADARRIRPYPGFRAGDGTFSGGFRVGDPVPGPAGYGGEASALAADYAAITGFATSRTLGGRQGIFTVTPSERWCAGSYTDPNGDPAPASESPDPAAQPDYRPGWATFPTQFMTRYVVDRARLYTIDTKGTLRTRPPRRLAVSRGHDLVATGLRWRRWGRSSAVGRGTLTFAGRRLAVRVEFYNPELIAPPDPIPGCPRGRVYYHHLAVAVPAWDAKTTYAIGRRCTTSVVNNAAGDLHPPRGSA